MGASKKAAEYVKRLEERSGYSKESDADITPSEIKKPYKEGAAMETWQPVIKENQYKAKEIDTVPDVEMIEKKKSERYYKQGGAVRSASQRADGCAVRGKTRA